MSQSNTEQTATPEPKSVTGQWSDLIGHEQIRNWFATAIEQGRFGGSMLFVGPPGSGKRTAANGNERQTNGNEWQTNDTRTATNGKRMAKHLHPHENL